MNPIYSILESPHRWAILASLSFGAGFVGTIAILAWGWSHTFARLWFFAGLLLAVFFCARLFLDWKSQVDEATAQADRNREPLGPADRSL